MVGRSGRGENGGKMTMDFRFSHRNKTFYGTDFTENNFSRQKVLPNLATRLQISRKVGFRLENPLLWRLENPLRFPVEERFMFTDTFYSNFYFVIARGTCAISRLLLLLWRSASPLNIRQTSSILSN